MSTKILGLAAGAAASTLFLSGCATYGDDYRAGYGAPPGEYYAEQYYRDDPRYTERRLHRGDRVYVGRDGRYYCRRSDGTTGLIVGGIAGGALGAAVTSGRSEPLGIILGAAAGAVAGQAIDKDNVRCR